MGIFIDNLRSGAWVTAERMRSYAGIVFALGFFAIAALLATSNGLIDYQRRPLGTDFSNVYAAGKYVLEGKPDAPFSPPRQYEKEQSIFGADTPFYGWHYPPVFLALAALLALLPYFAALALWQLATLALYLWNVLAITRDPRAFLPALAFPAAFINLAHGQNGFLTAALLGGGMLFLDRTPALAGVLLGLLVYKPQFGLLVPLVLAVSARWRVFWTAAATVIVICAATYLAYGGAVWDAFRESLTFTRTVVLEEGGTGFYKIQSPFAAVRLWGGPVLLAYAAQAIVTLAVAFFLVRIWRSESALPFKAAALIAGALLVTPYSLDYDLVVIGPAVAFLAAYGLKRGFLPYEKSALAFCWLAPLITRATAQYIGLPLGLIALLLLFALAYRRAVKEGTAG
ncbi:MAG TPA: glycosyltransferase family 87 protein [Xanthobacteraceae bacterium]|nr:glycosyltransferase family 87 protein [Xanthobacteraceae bacterium]